MKTRFLLLVLLVFLFACFKQNKQSNSTEKEKYFYWEDMTNSAKDSVLSLISIEDDVLKYYKNNYQLSDNEEINSLLDNIENWHNKPKEFYFYIFNTICENSDGTISELLGMHCANILLSNPNFVLNYFKKNKSVEILYATFMGSEFYFKEGGSSTMKYNYMEFKKMIDPIVDDDNEYIKKEFYSLIEKVITNMN